MTGGIQWINIFIWITLLQHRFIQKFLRQMKPYFTEYYANPSSVYSFAERSKKAVEEARNIIAGFIGAKTEEIYFTAGGSESDNWAIKETARAYADKGKHIITTTIEHHAVLHTCQALEKQGFEVTYVNVGSDGIIKLDELKAAIRPDTILISVMAANNEIGSIQPLAEIGALAKRKGYCSIQMQYKHLDIFQ